MVKSNVLKKTVIRVAAVVVTAGLTFGGAPITIYAAEVEDPTAIDIEVATDITLSESLINALTAVNNGLTQEVIGQLGVFDIDGTYSMVVDNGNLPAAVANSEGTIVVSMYEGTTINLNYQPNSTMVPAFALSQNGFVQGNPAFDGIALTGVSTGVDAVVFNVYADASHTVLVSQFVVVVNVLPSQATTSTLTAEDKNEILTPAQAEQYLLQLVNEARAKEGLAPYTYKQDIADELYEVIPDFANTCGGQSSRNEFGLSGGSYAYPQQYYGQKLTRATVRRIFNSGMRGEICRKLTIMNESKLYFGAAFYNNGKGWYDMFGAAGESRYWTPEQWEEFTYMSDEEFWSYFEDDED